MLMTEKEQIEHLSYHIVDRYFHHLDIGPLLTTFAADILWAGAGKVMHLSGYDAVSEAFKTGIKTMQHCVLTDIKHVNNSFAYNLLRDESFFATEQRLLNYQRLYDIDLTNLSAADKNELFSLLERSAYTPLDSDTQELFLMLSPFPYFSDTQAMYMWQRLNAKEMLLREADRHSFLYRDSRKGEYYFHPVYAEYLRSHFARQPKEWQHRQYVRAGRWFLASGDYEKAILYSAMASDDETLLTAIERGGLKALFALPIHIPLQLLERYSQQPAFRHFKGLLLTLLHVCLTHSKDAVVQYAPMLEALLVEQSLPRTVYREQAYFLTLIKVLSLYPDIRAMTTQAQRALEALPFAGYTTAVVLPWTFGSPSMLSIYHRKTGMLAQELETIDEFLSVYQHIQPQYAKEWHQCLHCEYDYLTGNPLRARQELVLFLQQTTLPETHLDLYLSALCYAAHLAVYTGEASILERYRVQMHSLALERQPAFYLSMLTLCDAYISALTSTDTTYATPAGYGVLPALPAYCRHDL